MVTLATAHPCKFQEAVSAGLGKAALSRSHPAYATVCPPQVRQKSPVTTKKSPVTTKKSPVKEPCNDQKSPVKERVVEPYKRALQ